MTLIVCLLLFYTSINGKYFCYTVTTSRLGLLWWKVLKKEAIHASNLCPELILIEQQFLSRDSYLNFQT